MEGQEKTVRGIKTFLKTSSYICCVCELERKYRSVFGVIILPSLVLEGKFLDVLLFGCVLLNFGDFLTES